MKNIRTLIVDDSLEFIDAAARFLSLSEDVQVVAHANTAKEAFEKVNQLHPDLVLMDLALPDLNGLEATQAIKAMPDPPHVILLTIHDNPEYRSASQAVQADGYISKSQFGDLLLPQIHDLFEHLLVPPA